MTNEVIESSHVFDVPPIPPTPSTEVWEKDFSRVLGPSIIVTMPTFSAFSESIILFLYYRYGFVWSPPQGVTIPPLDEAHWN
jgi:hypothetical protein